MAQTKWYPGGSRPITVTFTNSAGTAADPTTITLKVMDPTGAVATSVYGVDAGLTRTGTGAYQLIQSFPDTPSSIGIWRWKWKGTGAVTQTDAGFFEVLPTGFES